MKYLLLMIFIFTTACASNDVYIQGYRVKTNSIKKVGDLVYLNETGDNRSHLFFWNQKEKFPSLGIGHFIWYPKNYKASFGDTLPTLINFYKLKKIEVPTMLDQQFAPWDSREDFELFKTNHPEEVEKIISFFENTKEIQLEFMFNRAIDAFDGIVASSNDKPKVILQFNRIMKEKSGIYLIVDYINFKGEGASEGSSTGLRNILENMKTTGSGEAVYLDFASACKDVLSKRVYSSKNYDDIVFLPGWIKRCNSYIMND